MIRPKGLGRGLDALLAGGGEAADAGALQTIGRLVYPVLPATCRVIRLAILDCDPQQPEKTLQQIPACF